jgi:hypothetical protein
LIGSARLTLAGRRPSPACAKRAYPTGEFSGGRDLAHDRAAAEASLRPRLTTEMGLKTCSRGAG